MLVVRSPSVTLPMLVKVVDAVGVLPAARFPLGWVEVTVTVHAAVFPPSTVVTVIVAVPAATPVTSPDEFTVAIAFEEDDQVTDLLSAFAGRTVAVSVSVPPI